MEEHIESQEAVPEEQEKAETIVTPEQDELETLRAELEEANRKGEEYLKLLQRVQADFINYKRRVEQEKEEGLKFTKANIILKILPVLDDFDRALEATPENRFNSNWLQGIELIERKLQNILENEGVTKIEAMGKDFYPWEHEAVVYEESDEYEDGQVIAVLQEGYKLYDRVIRPAQVKVAKRKKE
ncbi:MAG: nucleotide exchange factor GrpE [Chloroflexi bacterium]|nr:nucleotide exchange factor GrpE [Chloroflexota bacterium]MCL5076044.1 nucleotide exchange factor GrpE [Chloroflexota bacterium]